MQLQAAHDPQLQTSESHGTMDFEREKGVTEREMENMKTIHVVAAIIRRQQGDTVKIFSTQRGYGEFKGGWEFPGGKIEPGEMPEQALVREIREELNVTVQVGRLVEIVEYDYPEFHLSMHCFLCELLARDASHLELREHEVARWLARQDMDSVDWLPADQDVADKLKADDAVWG